MPMTFENATLTYTPSRRNARFVGGPYEGKEALLPHNTESIKLTWKDGEQEDAGIYRWDENELAFVWEQISGRPCDALPV